MPEILLNGKPSLDIFSFVQKQPTNAREAIKIDKKWLFTV